MTTENNDPRSYILSLSGNKGFLSEAAQIKVKALLTEVAEEVPPFRWSYVPQRIIKNMVIAKFEMENLLLENSKVVDELSGAAKEFALIWEALAEIKEGTSKKTALLNAAVNYELAGYQANSSCIARRLVQSHPQIESPPEVEFLTALFLQRRFLQLLSITRKLLAKPGKQEETDLSLIKKIGVALSAKAFATAMRFFLAGDTEALNLSAQLFSNAEKVFASISLVPESNLIRSLPGLLPVMASRSTWNLLIPLAPDQPRWTRYLKLLARGVSPHLFYGRSISELWPSQMAANEKGLLTSDSNKIVRMPTSAGKTRIAELAIVHTLINTPGSRCVYVAPYRALVSEIEQSFLSLLNDLGFRVASVIGSYESDDFEELLLSETDVLVLTPEKLDLLRRAHPEFLDNVRLFVLDEGHIVHDSKRGAKFELLLTGLKRKLQNARFIFLSAVISQETLEEFAEWFNASEADVITSRWRPSIQRYAKFEWAGLTGVLRFVDEDNPLIKKFVPGVIKQHQFEFRNPNTGRINRERFPDTMTKAHIAAELAFKFAELGPVLIFCAIPKNVEAVGKALQRRLELCSLSGEAAPQHFSNSQAIRSTLLAREWLGETLLISLLDKGIGLHYGSLPDAVRNSIETDFRQKNLRVLIATNTLAQGVNLPIRTVIIHSCGRYLDNSYERIPARDYWNIAGRAGRAGEETEGIIIHIRITERDQKDFDYYLSHREEVEDMKGAIYQKLLGLVQERLSEEGLIADIDPEVLALLAEEGPDATPEKVLTNMEGSLVRIQAARHPEYLSKLDRLVVATAQSIIERIPDPEYISVYSSSGLSSHTCELLRESIIEKEESTRDILSLTEPDQLETVIDALLPVCLSLPEMQPRRDFGGSYSNLLKRWVSGVEISDLIHEFGPLTNSPDDLGRFIDDLFRYRLPWGVSGYLKISMKVLGMDRSDLPDFIKFIPTMIKYGLPNHTACWAMSLGIPSRQIAIRLAAAYRDEASSAAKYQEYLTWLGTLSIERLQKEFGLSGPLLQDVSRSIFITGINPILREFKSLEDFLPVEVDVKGINYGNRAIAAMTVQPGQEAELVRDYDNYLDRNAILVRTNRQEIGYLSREVSQILAPEIDTGALLNATVTAIERAIIPKVSIRIHAPSKNSNAPSKESQAGEYVAQSGRLHAP